VIPLASLLKDEQSGRYRIRFRYAGQPYNRSIKTTDRKEAESIRGRVEETLRLIAHGRLEVPANADPARTYCQMARQTENLLRL